MNAFPEHKNIQTKISKRTPLLLACQKRQTALAWQLLDSDADITILDAVRSFYIYFKYLLYTKQNLH